MTAPIHIRAQPGDVAPIVLLPGDPGRATRVAERLEGARCYNEFRGLLGYTGIYKGTTVSVQTTGMGAPAATYRVVRALVDAAERLDVRHHVGPVATEDALYAVTPGWADTWAARGVLAQEMETSAIFTVAALRALDAGCLLVVSNSAGQHERLPDEELSSAIDRMIEVALEATLAMPISEGQA